ncbi:MAG TPA: hypothetical protein VK446_16710, partial [Methylocystis sp.]|nr:hypothetical protein [Methylocystis sp.]
RSISSSAYSTNAASGSHSFAEKLGRQRLRGGCDLGRESPQDKAPLQKGESFDAKKAPPSAKNSASRRLRAPLSPTAARANFEAPSPQWSYIVDENSIAFPSSPIGPIWKEKEFAVS